MSFFRKFLYCVFALTLILYLFRGFIYRETVTYEIIGTRENINTNSLALAYKIDSLQIQNSSIESIIQTSLDFTSNMLIFSFSNSSANQNLLLKNKKANCIGYANFFTSTCNQLLVKNNLDKQWQVENKIAKIRFLGFNIHKLFNSPFFKDHDIVVIKNIETNEQFVVDPSLYDYFKIKYVTLKP